MRRLAPSAPFLAGAIGLWLGVEAIRSFITIIVWNVAEDLPSTQLGLVGAAFWIVGLLGWLPARLLARTGASAARVALVFGALVAVLTVLRQGTQDETWTAVFSIAAAVAWLWWLPAWLHATALAGRAPLIAPALVVGMAAQVSGQVALDGLDLHALPGLPAAAATLVLGGLFALALHAAEGTAPEPAGGTAGSPVAARWGTLAVLPWLLLQLTLLANIGRLEALGGWNVPVAGLVAAAGLLLAALTLALRLPGGLPDRTTRLALALVTAALLDLAFRGGAATSLLVPAQASLAFLLQASLAGRTIGTRAPRSWLATGLGGVAFFGFLFAVYYTALDDTGPFVWPLGVLVTALPGIAHRGATPAIRRVAALRLAAAVVGVAVVGTAVGALPARAEQPTIGSAPARLTLLNYNIHEGFSRTGYPNLERIADFIRAQNADLITLQEVPRVWDLSGAVDTFSWLAERLPEYRAFHAPTSRVRFGNAIFSRYPVKASGFQWFPFGPSKDQRGFAWVELDTAAGPLLVVTMHMTPYTRADEIAERDTQAQVLLDFWAAHGKGLVILAGDYNSEPEDPAYARTVGGGLVDALRQAGLGDRITFRSTGTPFLPAGTEQIDYVFVNPTTRVIRAEIPETDVSDHYPLLVTLNLAAGR